MSESPETAPVDPPQLQTTVAPDPLVELALLRDQFRHWRRTALGLGAAFVFLFVLSLVQFLGTLTACKLYQEARRESVRVNRETAEYLREIRSAHLQIQKLALDVDASRAVEKSEKQKEVIDQEIAKEAALVEQAQSRQQAEARGQVKKQELEDLLDQIRKNREAMKKALPGHEPDKNCPFQIKNVPDSPSDGK